MSAVRHSFTATPQLRGARLDVALAHELPDRSRNYLAHLIGAGYVSVDGAIATKPGAKLKGSEQITIQIPPPSRLEVTSQDLPLDILYQDEDLAVIDKPAGMVVHPGAGHGDETLVNALLHHLRDLSGIGGELRPGIVHRLDKETSGLLVVAKNDLAHQTLKDAWGSDRVRKEYLALVYGTPKAMEGRIDAPIGRDPRDRKRMAVVSRGRPSLTLYTVVEKLRYVSLLRCHLKSGRTHQIRVHLKSIGHPIVGDPLYSGPQWKGIPDKKLQKTLASFPRQALHAARLEFPHPRTGKAMGFESPLPEDFARLLERMKEQG